ncbi:MAG TPA: hypothetical protein VGO03_07870 [Acidimicrobiia bacterium]|jgi:hypothetical protein
MNEETLRDALRDAPVLTLDSKFAEDLEYRLRNAAAAAPVAELELARQRHRPSHIALIATAAIAVLAIATALAWERHNRHVHPTFPIDRLRYHAEGVFYTGSASTTRDDSSVDPISGAASFLSQTPRPVKDGGTRTYARLFADGRVYQAVGDWTHEHGWPTDARLALLRGKDWVDQGTGTIPAVSLAELPVRWQHERLAHDRHVRRVGPATVRGIATVRYRVIDPTASATGPMEVWVDDRDRVVHMELHLSGQISLVYDYKDFGAAPPEQAPNSATVVSVRVLDNPTLCNARPLEADLVTSCRVHPGIATSGYRYTQTWHQVALDGGFTPVSARTDALVDATRMDARLTRTDSDRPGITTQGELVNDQRYGSGITEAQMTFSLGALVDGSPFIGTFDVIDGLRHAGLSGKQVSHDTIRGIHTTHYRGEHTVGPSDTAGGRGEHLTFDVWVDAKGHVVRMVITEDVPADAGAHVHPQHNTDAFDFFDYGIHPTIKAPKATSTGR